LIPHLFLDRFLARFQLLDLLLQAFQLLAWCCRLVVGCEGGCGHHSQAKNGCQSRQPL